MGCLADLIYHGQGNSAHDYELRDDFGDELRQIARESGQAYVAAEWPSVRLSTPGKPPSRFTVYLVERGEYLRQGV